MRKLNKICDKATKYKSWIDNLCANEEECTKYYSGQKYVKDIKANLLLTQDGVCAYSEIRLDDVTQFKNEDWQDGVYIGNKQFDGELDHFDSAKKKKGRESWLWGNFFFVHQAINKSKNDSTIYKILKPDEEEYDPFKYLYYDSDEHMFVVSPSITDPEQREQVRYMINKCVLLNYGRIKRERKKYLDGLFKDYYADNSSDITGLVVEQFFTAFAMMKKEIELKKKVSSTNP